ncbi:lysophospholipase L1-like esterase (plasmid) [Mycobacterium sp. JS623]|uniref:SGNH/GDSL hydrolase family protein n=1 Tax=Mycobacterium sp. JS623 TaxID=212767 RepID=UPI0002A55BDF|nr:SGNH/GDSL hydrolase family protein [Mycobacterium sp. JS623]AGB26666.1 lysophospholipase L1-like esterase [Mycobacterium sp. JS623]
MVRAWLVAAIAVFFAFGDSAPVDLVDQPTPVVNAAFLGDSYTAGSGASQPDRRWTTLVSTSEGWIEHNFGLGGTGYSTRNNYLSRIPEIIASKPDVVVVSGGINDWPDLNSDPTTLFQEVRDTYLQLRQDLPMATIIGVGPTFTSDLTPARVEFNQTVSEAVTSVGGVFVSLILPTVVIEPAMVNPDRTHVNDSGHAAIAQRVISALTKK